MKPVIDDRYDVGHVVSHAGAKMRAVTATTSAEVQRLARGYDAVGIDEVQFFDDGIIDAIDELVGAVRASSQPASPRTSAACRSARCRRCSASPSSSTSWSRVHRCGGPATMTQRLVDGSPAPFEGETIQVGALDSYEARCRACFEPGKMPRGSSR